MNIKTIDGLPVLNAKRPIRVRITSGDIENANTRAPNACAVARACKRELHVKEARIHLGRIYLRSNDSNWQRYLTPQSMRREIIAFDRGGDFEPQEFRLAPPQPSKRTGKKQSHSKSQSKKAGKKRQPPTVVKNVRGGPA